MKLILILLAALVSRAHADCSIQRRAPRCEGAECAPAMLDAFENYKKSNMDCGVFAEAAPYVLRSTGKEAKGTVVLVHGLAASPAHLRQIAEKLQASGYDVVAPILKGHGGYDELLKKADFKEWTEDVKFAGDIASGLTKPTFLMGHSTGGLLAAYEASERPGKYNAIVGWDPALNLDGPKGPGVQKACIAKHVPGWNFLSDLPTFLQGDDEEHPEGPACNHHQASLRSARDLQAAIKRLCGLDDAAPIMNFEFTLTSLCALSEATQAMTAERMKKLPPSLAILSKDKKTFGYISQDHLKDAVLAKASNKVIDSDSKDHRIMPTGCSPSFATDYKRAEEWLKKHPGVGS